MIAFIGCPLNAPLDRDVSEAAASDPRQTVIADTRLRRCAGHDRENVVTAHFLEGLALQRSTCLRSPQRPSSARQLYHRCWRKALETRAVLANRTSALRSHIARRVNRRWASLGARIAKLRGDRLSE
jgi:hypothetical protein